MADRDFELDVLGDLHKQAAAVSQLARAGKSFLTAFEAIRSGDRKAFQTVLKRQRLIGHCHLVCEWIRIKECLFLCLHLCGPPKPFERPPSPRVLAESIVRITSDEKAVQQLARAVEKRDRAAFQRLVKAYRLGPICHLFCHWVCYVHYRRICRWVCEPELVELPDLVHELRAAGHALGLLLEDGEAFDAAVAASNEGDAEKFRDVLERAQLIPFCHYICFFFCSWRCVLLCLRLCVRFPFVRIEDPLQEALAFAKATRALSERPAELERLSAAVGAGDEKAFAAIVDELQLQRYCIQLCHWICFLRCRWFCIRVCPKPDTTPLFTHVGQYRVNPIYGHFQPDGTTTSGGYAFTRRIPLIGVMPGGGQAVNAYEYRFRIARHPTLAPVQDVVPPLIGPTVIGHLDYWYFDAGWHHTTAEYWVNNPAIPLLEIKQPGPSYFVPLNKNVKPGGWIEVPTENDPGIFGKGRFLADTGRLAELDTTLFTNEFSDLTVPAPGLKAGDPLPGGIPPHSEAPTYRIFFEARKVGTIPLVAANNLDKIAFSNTAYKYVRHAEWDGGPVTTRAVCSLAIAEMIAPGATGCDKQQDHVHALYTCYHPYLGSVLLWLQGPGIPTGVGIPPSPAPPAPFSFAPAVPPVETVSGAVGHDFDISSLQPCAYILWMSATVRLTEGWGLIPDATDWDVIAFCKA